MRVELSPWQFADISNEQTRATPGSSSKRRRDRSVTGSQSTDELCVIASFIEETSSSSRSRKKRVVRRGTSEKVLALDSLLDDEDRIPVITATTAHRISVLVETDSRHAEVSSTDAEKGFFVSSTLQYVSRPGKATSFHPHNDAASRNGATKLAAHDSTVAIPAVFDALRSRAYALQDNNTKLLGMSGDEVISVRMASPVLSLSLLHLPRTRNSSSRCLLYGTCQDSTIFAACLVKSGKEQSFAVEHVKAPAMNVKGKRHVGTFATIQTGSSFTRKESTGTKRALNDNSTEDLESLVLVFYQLFQDNQGLHVSRLYTEVADPGGATEAGNEGNKWFMEAADTFKHSGATISVNLLPNASQPDESITHATALGLVEGNEAVSIFYTIGHTASPSTRKTNGTLVDTHVSSYYTAVSLVTGKVISNPVCLPTTTKQIGLVGPALLALLTSVGEIVLYDTIRGSQVYSCEPLASSSEKSSRHTLVTDSKRSRLAIVFEQGGIQKVAFASARAENGTSMQPLMCGQKLSLASGLASSLHAPSSSSLRRTYVLNSTLASDVQENCSEQKAASAGVRMLEVIKKKMHSLGSDALQPNFLLEAYTSALAVAQGTDLPLLPEKNGDNPQDAILSTNGKRVNGFHHKSANHSHTETEHQPRGIPQMFVDCAVSIAISVLSTEDAVGSKSTRRNDARAILRQLVQSGNISARNHLVLKVRNGRAFRFVELLIAMEVSQDEGVETSKYTPFDLMNDMFLFIPEISEHQMISMLHYTVTRSLPNDIASWFARESKNGQHSRSARYARLTLLESRTDLSDAEEHEKSKLRTKLIFSGTFHLIQCIIKYSKFNSSLMRDALRYELTRDEVVFLTRCLVKRISRPVKLGDVPTTRESINGIKWLTVLYDTFRDVYSEKDRKRIKRSISKVISKSSVTLSLRKSLQDTVALIDGRKTSRSEASNVTTDTSDRACLPTYQFERLVF